MGAPRFAAGFAGGLSAFRATTVASDNVKARLISEVDAIAPGQSIWVALEFEYTRWLAHVLAQPRGFGPGDQIDLDAACRRDGGGHRLDRAASLRNCAAGQLRLRQACHASGADHGSAGPQGGGAARCLRRKRAGWSAPTCAFPRAPICNLRLPVNGCEAAHSTRPPRPCSRRPAASCRARQPAPTSARIRDGQLMLTLGKEWGRTLSQIKTLAFYPLRGRRHRVRRAADARRAATDAVELAMKIGYQPPQSGPIRGVLLATEQSGNESDRGSHRDRREFRWGRRSRAARCRAGAHSRRGHSAAAGAIRRWHGRLRRCRCSCCWPFSAG